MNNQQIYLTRQEMQDAFENLKSVAKFTPLEFNPRLSKKYQANIYFKREDLQPVRSFKIRGSYNLMVGLNQEEKKRGVICVSTGNHARGVAYSCQKLKIKGTIFMPTISQEQKIQKVREIGGDWVNIKIIGSHFQETMKLAQDFQLKNNLVFVHPYNDRRIMAGSSVIAKEIQESLQNNHNTKPDYILVAIGGGGMGAGLISYFKEYLPETKVIGVEEIEQAAMKNSLEAGQILEYPNISTFADGTAVSRVGDLTFPIFQESKTEIVTVEEGRICRDMIELYQDEGIITEPSGALAVSGLWYIRDKIKGKNVVCIICGGNNDITRYSEIIEKSLIWEGLKHYFVIEFTQKSGELRHFLDQVLEVGQDITRFEYIKKADKEKGPALIGLQIQNKGDLVPLLTRFENSGISYKRVLKGDLLYELLV